MKSSYTVLYVDDDHDDLQLIAEAFLKYTEKLRVAHARNGLEAIQVLEKMKAKASLPCLIIMDLNMPIMGGLEALVKIKSQTDYANIPIVLFSTSNRQSDKAFAEKWGVGYITKPSKFQDLEGLVEQFVSRCVIEMEKTS